MEILSLLFGGTICIIFMLYISRRKSQNQLRGPYGVPFLGYLPFITGKLHEKLTELSMKFGPIYEIKLGAQNYVVLCDYQAIKEAYDQDSFFGRPTDWPFSLHKVTIETGAFCDMAWKEQRRFSMRLLQNLGFGTTRVEENMHDEIQHLLQKLEEKEGKFSNLCEILLPSITSNIYSMLFGKRLKREDPIVQKITHWQAEVGRYMKLTTWLKYFPWIKFLAHFFGIGQYRNFCKLLDEEFNHAWKEIADHEENFDPSNVQDFVDGYLQKIYKEQNNPKSSFKKEVLADIAKNLLGASGENIRRAIEMVLRRVASDSTIQSKIWKEIDEILGHNIFPTFQDISKLPYTEAVILEQIRLEPLIPVNFIRKTLADTYLNGYFIPKNSQVLGILWAVNREKKLWGEDVYDFRPQRFLSKDGKTLIRPEHFIPFSTGKRACIGKKFAEIEILLYIVAILQKFELSLECEVMDGHSFRTNAIPKEPKICFKLRNK